ncbi:hypothetical protein HYDPIDRAFT_102552 [Hydnomerulius pinastri MD-312]|uniref:HAT C-terminal dimerisation domain-containing protein n=1 Tax=Hydnomerulius pinastri MD-312 TaxID=994086 RepID=A0A0C9VYL1_9AGAM|nr:hypothetical protein HYDPIDRAFT_102552 [Hydnomerulius pinastri MD-312]
MSGECTPLLGSAVPTFETFMTQWRSLSQSERNPQLAPFICEGLDWAETYHDRMRSNKVASTNPVPLCSFMTLASQYGLPSMKIRLQQQGLQSVEQEFNAYITSTVSHAGMDPVAFWELEHVRYPTVFRMAMDYLPIQVLAILCKHVFSSSSETDTKKRNRISPVLMEALQMLKFLLKKEHLNFTKGWIPSQKEMLHDEDTDDVLARLVTGMGGNIDDAINVITEEEGDTIEEQAQIF